MHRIAEVALVGFAVLAAAPWAGSTNAPSKAPPGPRGTLVTSNMNDNTASIIDVASNHVLATLPTGHAPHEVAISRDGRWAVVSNYGVQDHPGNSLTVIDLTRVAVARTIDLGEYKRPHGRSYAPTGTWSDGIGWSSVTHN